MNNTRIYNAAAVDNNTGSYPSRREDGSYVENNGQRSILLQEKYKNLKLLVAKENALKAKKDNILRGMLALEAPYRNDNTVGRMELEKIENEVEQISQRKSMLEEDIANEKSRLAARGFTVNNEVEPVVSTKSKTTFLTRLSQFKQNGKKYIGALVLMVVVEMFFGLTQFEALSEYKSTGAIALRIIASSLLIAVMHIAEYKYKQQGISKFRWFNLYGWITLAFTLVGGLVLNYFFSDIDPDTAKNIWDLGNVAASDSATVVPKSVIGFINKFDFLPAFLAIIVFMYLLFDTKTTDISMGNTHLEIDEDQTSMFNRLKTVEAEHRQCTLKLIETKDKMDESKKYSSDLVAGIKGELISAKSTVEDIEQEISDLSNEIDLKLKEVEHTLELYRTDFMDIFKDSPAASFVNISWPTKDDIRKFYNLN